MSRNQKKQANRPEPMDVDDSDGSDIEEGGTYVEGIYIPPPIQPYCSSESKGPRLIITNIELENFKSYANVVMLGPFHHKFSACIGPNGSGKSNVIDALLFVFGYRAMKIRSKKVSLLLHNSSRFPNVKSCKVAVHFTEILDNPDGSYTEIPGKAFVVERVAFKDSSSYYTIRGKKVHFKEVAKLLKSFGIDLDHNRFLILQGEVESIAMMKPKAQTENECGLLEYLEDIIGTTRYKKPLFLLNERVETLNIDRTEKHNRCKLAEREMQDLQEPMQKAVTFLELENDFYRIKNLQAQKYIYTYNKQIGEGEEHLAKATETLQEHDKKYEEIANERKEKEGIVEERMKSKESLFKRREKAENDLKAAQKKYDEVQENMKTTNNRRKQLKTSIDKEKAKLEDLRKVPEKNAVEIEECEKKVSKLSEQKTEAQVTLEKNMLAFKEATKELLAKKEKQEDELIGLREQADSDKSELNVIESKLKIVKHDEITEARKLETFKNNFEDSKKSLAEKKERIKATRNEVEEMIVRRGECQRIYNQNKAEEEDLSTKVKALRAKIDESNTEMQDSHSRGRVLDFLMKQKKDGRIPGIFGRLGDLGGIDARYDVAISTCCGRLDNIVVDTVDTAQACINALKSNNVGRGNFIALEKMSPVRPPNNYPNNVNRLYDLIHVEDEQVRPAFYFALRETLVANDLAQGTEIAYKHNYRVVTLKGEVIELSGTMSGGGRQMIRGKMGQRVQTKTKGRSSISNADLQRMQVDAENMQHRVNELQLEQGKLENELTQLQRTVKQKEHDVQRLDQEIRTLTEQLPKLQENLKRQEEKVRNTHSDEREVKVLEEQLAKLKKTAEASAKAAETIQTKVDGINAQIAEIQKEKIKTFKDKISSLTKQIDKLTTNMSKLNVEIKASERNVQKCEANIENTTQDITNCEENLRKDKEVREEAEKRQEELNEALKEISAEIAKAEEGFGDIRKEIAALQKKEHEGKVKRQELEQTVQGIQREIEELKRKIPHWQKVIRELKLHEIPNKEPPTPFKQFTDDELREREISDIQYEYSALEEKVQKKPNLSVIDEFKQKREVYLDRVKVLEDVTAKRNEMRQTYDDVRKHRFTEFMQGFTIINRKLKEMYQMITLGGDAELELVDSMDPFNEGIVFSVRPPKKSWKQISNLSGGEKTLSSLALVFALHYYKPSPLYVMDEIDAALDFKNVSIVANYIKERTKNAQFIIISLRSNMFELSDHLVGISKFQDCTKSVTIKNCQPIIRGTMSQVPNLTMNAFDTLKTQPALSQPTSLAPSQNTTRNESQIDESTNISTSQENASFIPTTQEGTQSQAHATFIPTTQEDSIHSQDLSTSSIVNNTIEN